MLNEAQQSILWESWLEAQVRSVYFAELSGNYRARQRYYTIASLLLSSGAFLSLFSISVNPQMAILLGKILAFLSAAIGIVSLVSRNEGTADLCADLHRRWNMLAVDYGRLWANVYADDAKEKLDELEKREIEISQASLPQQTVKRAMKRAKQHVFTPLTGRAT